MCAGRCRQAECLRRASSLAFIRQGAPWFQGSRPNSALLPSLAVPDLVRLDTGWLARVADLVRLEIGGDGGSVEAGRLVCVPVVRREVSLPEGTVGLALPTEPVSLLCELVAGLELASPSNSLGSCSRAACSPGGVLMRELSLSASESQPSSGRSAVRAAGWLVAGLASSPSVCMSGLSCSWGTMVDS